MVAAAEPPADPVETIPSADAIRSRLYRVRQEARLLARLLRISESKAIVLPPRTAKSIAGGQR